MSDFGSDVCPNFDSSGAAWGDLRRHSLGASVENWVWTHTQTLGMRRVAVFMTRVTSALGRPDHRFCLSSMTLSAS